MYFKSKVKISVEIRQNGGFWPKTKAAAGRALFNRWERGGSAPWASLSLLAFSGLFCDQLTLLQGLVTSCACRNFFLARTKFSSTRDSHRVHEKNRPMRSETLRRQHPRSTVFSTIISKTLLLLKSLFGFDFYLYNSVLTKKTKTESVFSWNCFDIFFHL